MERSKELRTGRPTPSRRNIARSTVVAAVLAASLVGCDTATEDDTIVLSGIRAVFEFEFDGSDVQVGELRDVSSDGEVSIASQLVERGGFTLAEIVSARVTSASMELVEPLFVDLRFLDEVVLQLQSGSIREVASRTGFTDQEPADLNVIQGRDVSTIVKSGSFSAVLLVRPNALPDNPPYVLGLMVDLTVELEGV